MKKIKHDNSFLLTLQDPDAAASIICEAKHRSKAIMCWIFADIVGPVFKFTDFIELTLHI
jgi:hypothetical protein